MLIRHQFVIQTDLLRRCSTIKKHIHCCSHQPTPASTCIQRSSTGAQHHPSQEGPLESLPQPPAPSRADLGVRPSCPLPQAARYVLKVSKDGVSPPRQLPGGFGSPSPSGTSEVAQHASSLLLSSMGAIVGLTSHQSLSQEPQLLKGDRGLCSDIGQLLSSSSLVHALRSWSHSAFRVSHPV